MGIRDIRQARVSLDHRARRRLFLNASNRAMLRTTYGRDRSSTQSSASDHPRTIRLPTGDDGWKNVDATTGVTPNHEPADRRSDERRITPVVSTTRPPAQMEGNQDGAITSAADSRAPAPVGGFLDLIDRALARGTTNWSHTWQMTVLLVALTGCLAGLMFMGHVWLGAVPWAASVGTATGTGVGSYILVRRRRRQGLERDDSSWCYKDPRGP
jgi:hypothetical protein